MPTVTIQPGGDEVFVAEGQTVLAGLYAAGYAYIVGCRRGGCGICKIDVTSGRFDYDRPVAESVLDAGERADGTCLSCRAVPESDITIEMRDDSLRLINPLLRQINAKARARAEALAGRTAPEEH